MKRILSFLLSTAASMALLGGCVKTEMKIDNLKREVASINSVIETLQQAKHTIEANIKDLSNDTQANSSSIKTLQTHENRLDDRITSLRNYVNSDFLSKNDAQTTYATLEQLQGALDDITDIRNNLPVLVNEEVRKVLGASSDTIVEQLRSLLPRVEALENMIQSLTLIPEYSDGKLYLDGNGTSSFTYVVSPKFAVMGLNAGNFSFLTTEAITKASSYTEVEVMDITIDDAAGTVTLIADMSDRINALGAGHTLMAAAKIVAGNTELVTAFAEVCCPAHNGVQLWFNGPKWALNNIGADNPWDYGCYFTWGNVTGYIDVEGSWTVAPGFERAGNVDPDAFMPDFYSLTDGGMIDVSTWEEGAVLPPANDAARASWGEGWRMASPAEIADLVANTVQTWVEDYNGTGVAGCIFTGKDEYSARSVFFPAAGRAIATEPSGAGVNGYYWSAGSKDASSSPVMLFDGVTAAGASADNRYNGCTIRPVISMPQIPEPEPEPEPEPIDNPED